MLHRWDALQEREDILEVRVRHGLEKTHGIAPLSGLTPATLPERIVWMKIASV
jgi:hypothetical protein